MPKSYELKLREAEERRRPRPKEELYKAVEGVSQKMLLGFDHPETLQLEMQLTWGEDGFTVDQMHEHLMSEVLRLNMEYKRRPLTSNYSRKYVWFDRFVLRPRIGDRELLIQDYAIQPGYRIRVHPFYGSERMWGMCDPYDPKNERPADQMDPDEDKDLLIRLDKGPPTSRIRLFCWTWLGGSSTAYIPMAQKMPKDVAVYVLELPTHGDRGSHEGYPDGPFAVEVMAKTLAKEMKKPGVNFFFGHSQGSHFMYYTAKLLRKEFNIGPKACFVSNFAVPASAMAPDLSSLRARQNACVPLRMFMGLVKGGWGTNPKLAYKSHMGWQAYQAEDLWPSARMIISDWWLTKEFPMPGADEPLDVPIVAFYGRDDLAVSLDEVMQWKSMTNAPEKFEVRKMAGGHLWFADSSKRSEELAIELANLTRRFG